MLQQCNGSLPMPETAFRDELSLDLEEGYNHSIYESFDGVRKLIEEEDLAKNRERFEELLMQVPEEVSGFSEALESHRDRTGSVSMN